MMVQTNGKLLLYKRSLVTGKKKKEKKNIYGWSSCLEYSYIMCIYIYRVLRS